MIKNLAALGAVVWLTTLLFFYVQLNHTSSTVPDEVMRKWERTLDSLNQVREQNDELKRLIEQERLEANALRKSILHAEKKESEDEVVDEPRLLDNKRDTDVARRELDNQIREVFFYIYSLKELNAESQKHATDQLLSVLGASSHLEHVDGGLSVRKEKIKNIAATIVRAFEKLQAPEDCKSTRALICNLEKECGFGCELHHVAYCAITAFATNRTLILKNDGRIWRYSKNGWNAVFLPISKCTESVVKNGETPAQFHETTSARVVELGIIDMLGAKPKFLPQAVPAVLKDDITRYHSSPAALFVGTFIDYLMRPNEDLKEKLALAEKEIPFGDGPIVGLQVRRTDKVGTEAAFHGVDEYMKWAEIWFQIEERRVQSNISRRVFVASDDPSVVPEAKKKYPNYQVYGSIDIAKTAQLGSRYTDASLLGVVTDIVLLSKVDYIVCTFSSQVCRMAYELKQPSGNDDGTKFHSIDDIYYFGGQQANNVLAVEGYTAENPKEIDFVKGDTIGIAGNHWDGFSMGTNRRTGKSGLFPSYKTRQEVLTYDFKALLN